MLNNPDIFEVHTVYSPGNNLSGIASQFAIQISHSCNAFLLAIAIICDAFCLLRGAKRLHHIPATMVQLFERGAD